MRKLEAGYHRELYEVLSTAYAIAWHLERNRGEWREFIREDFFIIFKKKPTPQKTFLFVLYFVFDATTKPRQDRAWKYARALEYYHREGVPSAKVAEKLKLDGGVEAVCTKAIEEDPRRLKPEITTDDDDFFDVGEPAEEDAKFVLEVEMEDDEGELVLGLAEGRKARITVERVPGNDHWKRIVATRVKRLKAE